MNPQIDRLFSIANAPERLILGLMSGTSLDGLDLALCRIQGAGLETRVELMQFHTIPYSKREKEQLLSLAFRPDAPLEKVTQLHKWIAVMHARMILASLEQWSIHPSTVDLVASHGQTIFHAPGLAGNSPATFQIGDGDHIASHTGIICISDFRQKHIAAGGEGAPLAPYGDYLLFSDQQDDVLLINIGGITNLTYIPAGAGLGDIVAGDTGPGNTLMNACMRALPQPQEYDAGGALAATGTMNETLLLALLDDPFFNLPLPKSTGPEYFNRDYLSRAMEKSGSSGLPAEDIMATLNRLTAISLVQQANILPGNDKRKVYISGGGVHNTTLMNQLRKEIIGQFTDLPFSPDAKEAILFAVLANETVAGDPQKLGRPGTNLPLVSMGKISLPG